MACLFLRYFDYVNQLNVNTVNIYQIGIFADVKMCHNSYLKQTIFGFELYFFFALTLNVCNLIQVNQCWIYFGLKCRCRAEDKEWEAMHVYDTIRGWVHDNIRISLIT